MSVQVVAADGVKIAVYFGCYVVPSVSNLLTFRRNVLPQCPLQEDSGSAFLRKEWSDGAAINSRRQPK